MDESQAKRADFGGQPVLSDGAAAALAHLWKAYWLARGEKLDTWQSAESLLHLAMMGVDETDLRWLVLHGFAEHGEELTTNRDGNRRFRRGKNLAFPPRTCFVLTKARAQLVQARQKEASPAQSA